MITLKSKSNEDLLAMQRQAKVNPNGYVYEIDGPHLTDHYVPPEAIRGAWKVDSGGHLTDVFEPNENFREIINAKRQPPAFMKRMENERFENNLLYANQWFPETAPDFGHLFPDIPDEGFVGHWYIGADGTFTGWFRPNPHYKGNILT